MAEKWKRISCLTAVAAMLAAAGATVAFGLPSGLLLVEDFETGAMRADSMYTSSGNVPQITTEQVRGGRYAMKSYLNRGNSPTSYRTEISVQNPKTLVGDERWYGFSIFLPTSYKSSPVWEIVAQWHDTPDSWEVGRQNPPLHLATSRGGAAGHWTISNLWDADRVTSSGDFKVDGSKVWDLGPYQTNVWTDWVFHIKWSYDNDGLLQVWKNGELVVERSGPNCYNDNTGPYFKMGIYKGWRDRNSPADTVSERTLYHDELRIAGPGGSFAAVSPGGPAPIAPKPPTDLRAQ